jgi:hypothetical protein
MSNCGPADALGTDGDSADDVLPRAKVPPLVWKVGYPAGKFVVKPGKLVMVNAGLLQEPAEVSKAGWLAGDERTPVCARNLPSELSATEVK